MNLVQIRNNMIRALLTEGIASFWTDTQLDTFINLANQKLVRDSRLILYGTRSLAGISKKRVYDLPKDIRGMLAVTYQGKKLCEIGSLHEWHSLIGFNESRTNTGTPTRYLILDRNQLLLDPAPASNAVTTTVRGNQATQTSTTIDVNSTGSFTTRGVAKNTNTEEIFYYDHVIGDAFTGVRRGMERSVKADLSDGDTIQQLDIVLHCGLRPKLLTSYSKSTIYFTNNSPVVSATTAIDFYQYRGDPDNTVFQPGDEISAVDASTTITAFYRIAYFRDRNTPVLTTPYRGESGSTSTWVIASVPEYPHEYHEGIVWGALEIACSKLGGEFLDVSEKYGRMFREVVFAVNSDKSLLHWDSSPLVRRDIMDLDYYLWVS